MKGKQVLVIDDEPDLREAIAEALQAEKFEVLQAENGKEGMRMALKEHPDLILLDLMMPEQDGHDTLRMIRNDSWGKNAKILLLTALDDATNISRAVEHGSDDYVIKSSNSLDDIVSKVRHHIAGYV